MTSENTETENNIEEEQDEGLSYEEEFDSIASGEDPDVDDSTEEDEVLESETSEEDEEVDSTIPTPRLYSFGINIGF